ncbi:ribonuclease HI family protein [Patescibacteria group bacterium]|nr:ribonuclease HI family protein [Patescibacteria group bacterium]
MSKAIKIYTDGGARGNPGPAAVGAVAYTGEGKEIWRLSRYIGNATNNIAEYNALLFALKKLAQQKDGEVIEAFLDSELVVKQLKGEYRVKDEKLKILFHDIKEQLSSFTSVQFNHVKREQNKVADSLVNKALDERANV